MIEINEENSFELYEAMYCYASLNHQGQSSELYSVLSQSEFKPSKFWNETDCIAENPYYDLLDEKTCIDLARQFAL